MVVYHLECKNLVLVSGRPGLARAVFKAARLARNGLKKSQTLIVFVGEGRSFKKSEPGQVRAEWGRFGRWLSSPQANTTKITKQTLSSKLNVSVMSV
jgi:hypothetical protein